MFSKRLSSAHLTGLCRDVRHFLGAGLSLADAFDRQAKKGPAPVRPSAERIVGELKHGHSLGKALQSETDLFPPLVLSLVDVGEASGMLAEVFDELEKYYARQQQLRRQFLGQITWPAIQFLLAVFVLAGLIFVMGLINGDKPAKDRFDPLGLGLFGARGAILFIAVVFGTLAAIAGLYLLLTRVLKKGAVVDGLLLRIPAVGPCLRCLAVARFCLALRLTFLTSMSMRKSLRLALRASGNHAFMGKTAEVEASIEEGRELADTLAATQLFPEEFIHVLAVGEESGRLTHVLKHQADHYNDESGRRLSVLTQFSGFGVWALVAALIIWAIFRLFSTYLGAIGGGI